jgi:hypothetical protein
MRNLVQDPGAAAERRDLRARLGALVLEAMGLGDSPAR